MDQLPLIEKSEKVVVDLDEEDEEAKMFSFITESHCGSLML